MSDINNESARQLLVRMWNEAWEGGLWAAPWKQALDGLTPEQAAHRQGPERRSIWEIAAHVCFWREHELRRLSGEKVPAEEIESRNYERPGGVSEQGWGALKRRFEQTHQQLASAMADEKSDLSRIQYLVPHDSYHVGQIMTLRAMLGLTPVN